MLTNVLIRSLMEQQPLLAQLDAITGLIFPALETSISCAPTKIATELQAYTFYWIGTGETQSSPHQWLLETATGALWIAVSRDDNFASTYSHPDAANRLKRIPNIEKSGWQLPTGDALWNFAGCNTNPWREGSNRRLFSRDYWLISGDQRIDLDNNGRGSGSGYWAIATNHKFVGDLRALIAYALQHQWRIVPIGKSIDNPEDNVLNAYQKSLTIPRDALKAIDARSARLPELDDAYFTDPAKGLWELWGMDQAKLQEAGLRARNPALDVREGMVAIDFGTSSTVVACEEHGVGRLLRIGISDFWQKEQPDHYENPTVLELVDWQAFLKAWHTQAQRPPVSWDDARCSHEALHNFRNNQTKPEVVASILTKIKRWALDEDNPQYTRLRITDQTHREEHEIPPLTLRNPVKGEALRVGTASDYPFDPIELYAWFLGLTINWRGRGLHLRYYMSFPVDYPREIKDKILASFRRGLWRSFPAPLIGQSVFERFTVEERANEPAAYAAIAMSTLGIEPTDDGVAYAVFDFGGGTTDFDFGIYRWPTEEEERKGIEQVFEHFGSGGDKFLGGENLLEHMAYLTFQHNLEVCRKNKVAFSRPMDASDFNGSEMFLEHTQAAATNTLMLIAKLRPFWETGQQPSNSTGVEKIDLISRDGKKVPCEFSIPYEQLHLFLQDRIAKGVENFFSLLKKSFGYETIPSHIDVLLAGNASRSNIVLGLFGLLPQEHELAALKERITPFLAQLFPNGDCPEFLVHQPLAADPNDINRPTCKTGVALGLLQLCPGSATKVVNHAVQQTGGEAPFQHFVGRIRRNKFHAALHQGAAYGQWVELGPLSEDRVFRLFHTQAALALGGTMAVGDAALKQKTLEFPGKTPFQVVLARALKPHEIEVCTATSAEAAQANQFDNKQTLRLM